MPGGGCVPNALTRLRIFSHDCIAPRNKRPCSAAKAGLNAQIDPVHNILRKSDPNIERKEAGVDNEIWHYDCVKRAVIDQGYHFLRLKIDPTDPEQVNLSKEFSSGGSYLVDGLVNSKFKKSKNGKKGAWEKRYDDEPDPANADDWHMVGVQNRKILDHEFAENGDGLNDFPVDCFWLRSNSTPHPTHGYFRCIRRVYRVPKCTKAEGHCAVCAELKKRKRGA